ncbi:MAG: ABC transporter ATP-binding protein [Treponema sp.]|jgi:ABC-2 type transport system ATP-binding protein|nr:ABC transporter ATP-binding protein [Treponema sp.]
MKTILSCRNLTKQYGTTTALDNVDLDLPAGSVIGLLGPNASGKSTFIKIAAGLLTLTSGELLIDNNKPGVKTKEIVSYLPDHDYLNDWMSVNQLVKLFEDFYTDFDKLKAFDMIQRLNIKKESMLKTLSKGTREKVQLVLTMSRKAKLYLLDEPIGGVDPAARDYILNTIIGNYSENAAVLISTHLIADVEAVLTHAVFIKNGKIVRTGDVDTIREETNLSIDALFREEFKC